MDNSAWPNVWSAAPLTARVGKAGRERADLIWNEDRVGRKILLKDAVTQHRGRRLAGFCQEQTDNFLNTRGILRASAKLWLLRNRLRIPAHPAILIFGLCALAANV